MGLNYSQDAHNNLQVSNFLLILYESAATSTASLHEHLLFQKFLTIADVKSDYLQHHQVTSRKHASKHIRFGRKHTK